MGPKILHQNLAPRSRAPARIPLGSPAPPVLKFLLSSAAQRAPVGRSHVHSAARFRHPYQPTTVFSQLPTSYSAPKPTKKSSRKIENEVDSWIDLLDETKPQSLSGLSVQGITADVTMAWLVQQSLSRSKIPVFKGSAVM